MAEKVALFDKAVRCPENEYVRFSSYARQVMPLVEAVGLDRIHVVWFGDIRDQPERVAHELFNFLAVDPTVRPPSLDVPENLSKQYRSPRVFRFLQRCVRAAEHVGLRQVIEAAKHGGVRDSVLRMLEVANTYPPMATATRQFLEGTFENEAYELRRLLQQEPRW